MASAVTALVVDEEEMNRAIIAGYLSRLGYVTLAAGDGEEAWRILEARGAEIHVILVDRRMAGINGLEFLARQRAHPAFAQIPVIVQTSADCAGDIAEAIRAGAFYYLAKPYDGELLRSVAAAAVENFTRLKRLEGDVRSRSDAIQLLHAASFRFRTPRDAQNLAFTLSAISPNTHQLAFGLIELLMNAVEHGNLGIGYALKGELKGRNALVGEIERRLELPEQRDRFATLTVERGARQLVFTVADQGAGFDWRAFLDDDSDRIQELHGRGITLARSFSFDDLRYLGCGNTAVATIDLARHGVT